MDLLLTLTEIRRLVTSRRYYLATTRPYQLHNGSCIGDLRIMFSSGHTTTLKDDVLLDDVNTQ